MPIINIERLTTKELVEKEIKKYKKYLELPCIDYRDIVDRNAYKEDILVLEELLKTFEK